MLIDIPAISLDVENFRHGAVPNERDAIRLLLSDEKTHKISELATDIVEMKELDPSSLLIVMEDQANDGKYIALEGNRRMTALKVLIHPDLAENLPTHKIFKALSPRFLALGMQKVECVVLDRLRAREWIKRKHYNAMGGRGVIEWNAVATARSDASEGRPPRWMIALSLIAKYGGPADLLLEGIAAKTTTVERVLMSPSMSTVLGVTFDMKTNHVVPENGDEAAASALLSSILQAMTVKSFKETAVTNADLQRTYLEAFRAQNVRIVSSPANPPRQTQPPSTSEQPNHATGRSADAGAPGTTPPQPATSQPAPSARSKPVRFRVNLADKGLRITNDALNKLYAELRRLNVEKNPHIGSAMVRVFLEKATRVFLDDMGIACRNPGGWGDFNVKLKDKVAAALHNIDPNKTDAALAPAWDVANGLQGKLHTLDNLNDAIHSHKALPSARDIVTIWDRYHPFLREIFETLEKNGK